MNNSATTRTISKIALEYNGNDKGMAIAVASNFLLSRKPEEQYQEMKSVAGRNPKVKKWALTGYISPPDEIGRPLTDEELTDIAIEALQKIGVTDNNQYRLDIHNSTKQKHIHFIVNRMNIDGKCTVKAHDIGKRFGDAVRQICKERSILTDIEIGIEKRAAMLKNLTESIKGTNNFEDLISEMKVRGFIVQLSKNENVGISGMRIIMEKDINHRTQRHYKPGYKLSEISNTFKIAEIKNIFDIKNALRNQLESVSTWKELQENMYRMGWFVKIQHAEGLKPNQKNEIKDFKIIGVGLNKSSKIKDGYFFKKGEACSLSAIDSGFRDLKRGISTTTEVKSSTNNDTFASKPTISETLQEVTEELIDDFLKPTYVAQDDEWWKKKRKGRR